MSCMEWKKSATGFGAELRGKETLFDAFANLRKNDY
jgi:hypothetical protein